AQPRQCDGIVEKRHACLGTAPPAGLARQLLRAHGVVPVPAAAEKQEQDEDFSERQHEAILTRCRDGPMTVRRRRAGLKSIPVATPPSGAGLKPVATAWTAGPSRRLFPAAENSPIMPALPSSSGRTMTLCPCNSDREYESCCGPVISGESPAATAEA